MRVSTMVSIVGLATLVSQTVSADPAKRAAGEQQSQARYTALDVNHDGKLSRDEFQAQHAQMWRDADVDHDGAVTLAEAKQAGDKMAAQFAQKRFAELDVNHDGRVTKEEAAHMPEQRFARIDSNSDGALTAEEMNAAHKAMGERGGHAGMPPVEQIFKRLDADSDGKLTAAELKAAPSPFDKLDADHDGYLSATEFKSGHLQGHGGGRGGHGGRGQKGRHEHAESEQ